MSVVGQLLRAGIESNGKDFRVFDGHLAAAGPVLRKTTVTNITTAAAVTFTAAQLLGGYITRDPAGGARADKVDTAANIIAAIKGAKDGDSFEFVIENTADASETITLTTNTGVTLASGHTMTVAQNESKRFLVVLSDVSASAVTVYNMGVFTT